MIDLYLKLEKIWFNLVPEKIRFLLVGGFNTCLSYVLFLIFENLWGYKIAVLATYIIAINVSILTMRYYVFRAKGPILGQYFKAGVIYVGMIIANYVFLAIAIKACSMQAWLAQALFTIFSTVVTYFLHKKICFI